MRTIDLSLYADRLAGEAASLAARIEREHGRIRQATIERAAREALTPVAVERLEALGLLQTRGDPLTLADLEETLDAVEALEHGWRMHSRGRRWPARTARRRPYAVSRGRCRRRCREGG
jgi:hypothetical protein